MSMCDNPDCWYSPTAKQLVATEQATLVSWLPAATAGLGLGTPSHRVPCQVTTRVRTRSDVDPRTPTPVHEWRFTQVTPRSPLSAFPGLGLARIVQRVPSHRSISVRWVVGVKREPTAKHAVLVAHATPNSKLDVAPTGFGLGTIDQWLPSQRSVSVRGGVLLLAVELPTATQLVRLVHETPFNSMSTAIGLGLATIVQLTPFHRSISVRAVPVR
jgi:hypothetical protein